MNQNQANDEAFTGSLHRGDRLESLLKRQAALRASITLELQREQRRKSKQQERLVNIVGQALLREAEQSETLRGVIRKTLDATVIDESARRLLSDLGWI